MDKYEDLIVQAARRIEKGRYVVAYTGAGISVESGIPSFRGKDGLWSRYDPRFVEIDYFLRHPGESWELLREVFFRQMLHAQPNAAHQVLARWEQRGLLKAVITQNIDNLHQEAGSRRVIEYHGNSRTLECQRCKKVKKVTPEDLEEIPPRCSCGGILKPGFVFFGEEIPPAAASAAFHEASVCDVMLVIGTTGSVMPANMIPIYASRSHAYIIEINPEPGEFTYSIVQLYLPLKAGEALTAIDQQIYQSAG
ncbi:MAG: SIR2 family NAD-dependent protein deacylase [Bacteroidales bacterium]